MTIRRSVPFLRVVEPETQAAYPRPDEYAPTAWQRTLFARENPSLLVFIDFEEIDEAGFLSVILKSRPRFVVDLRLVPHFDVGALNRKMAFSLFEEANVKYFDMSGRLKLTDQRDAQFNPRLLAIQVRQTIFGHSKQLQGPIAFIVDHAQFEDSYVSELSENLSLPSDAGWEIFKAPQIPVRVREKIASSSRNLVFISHANPQDNAFTLWLGSHLTCLGYEVWSDVTRLFGGEEFWDTIEDAIRKHSSKVVVVLSRVAQTKKGFLDEVSCAVGVERSEGRPGFVVPVRIDDLPFEDVRANLLRKNIVDFHGNWARGLGQLVRAFERDAVPKNGRNGAASVRAWSLVNPRSHVQLIKAPEEIVSNWLPILSLPDRILLHDVSLPNNRIDEVARAAAYPTFRYLRLVGSFADAAEMRQSVSTDIRFTETYRIPLQEFRNGSSTDIPGLKAKEASNFLSSLLRQAWNTTAQRRGLLPYTTASGAVAWYPPKGLIDGDQVSFSDMLGKARRKKLVGWSERRQLFWHLAMELRPTLGRVPRFVARSHVVFTSDGVSSLESKERMHVMRRRFCKSWWNDRWRDLLLAYVFWLAAGKDTFRLPLGAEVGADVGATPLKMVAPVSLADDLEEESLPDEVLDELELGALDEEEEIEFQYEDDINLDPNAEA